MTGLYIFIVFSFLEVILLILVLKTGKIDGRLKISMRLFSIGIVVLLLLINVLTWGFRYYGILIFLFGLLLIEGIKIISSDSKQRLVKKNKVIRKTAIFLLLLLIVCSPAIIFPESHPLAPTGEHEVLRLSSVFVDKNRVEEFQDLEDLRQVSVQIWYPNQVNEEFPLVVYSHGGISLESSNESLFLELASHGYVVVSIGHSYHSIVTKDQESKNIWIDLGYMNELNSENALEDKVKSYELYQKWMKLRTDDITFVIDELKIRKNEHGLEEVYQMIDFHNIGVIGHSLGGSAALCVGRTRVDVKAVIALESPFMCDIIGVEEDEFILDEAAYLVPALNVYSDSTWDMLSLWPQYEQNHHFLLGDEDLVTHHYISGTGHFSLTDLSLSSPLLNRMLNGFHSSRDSEEVLRMVNQYSLAFFDRWLKNKD